MPAIAAKSTRRENLMKQREKERLERLLSLMYGSKYPLHWTYYETSYFDGKACYVKWDVQTPRHRTFSLAEKRIIRQWTGFHERGHEHFDYLPDYIDWIEENMSNDFNEWEANEKYPQKWLQFFGNTALDGRMELLVTSAFPTQEDYFEFGNYEWRFGTRGEHAGEDGVFDFKECFMHRALGMEDIGEWDVEAINLVDAIQDDIDRLRTAATTQDCLDITLEIIKTAWPQLWEWMQLEENEPMVIEIPGTPVDDHDDENMMWGSKEQAEENTEKAFQKVGIKPTRSSDDKEEPENTEKDTENDIDGSEGDNTQEDKQIDSDASEGKSDTGNTQGDTESDNNKEPTNNDDSDYPEQETREGEPSRADKLQQFLDSVEQQMEKEQQDMDAQEEPFEERKENVEIQDKQHNISDHVTIKEYPVSDISKYNTVKSEVSQQIKPFGRAIKQILEGTPDEFRRNQKKGRLRVNSVWKAQRCNDVNIFDRTIKGTPEKNAVVFSQFDNSGSTMGGIVEQMQKSAVLITEGCEKAKVPHYSYAFTEEWTDTGNASVIYPLKPTNALTNREKGYIGGMRALMGNRDTLVLQWTVDQISKRQEEIKLLIMISDGMPIFEAGVEDESTMRNIVLKAEKQGIDVLCLFVGDHDTSTIEKVRYMYNNHVISVESNIAREMQKQVKRIIKKRRA